MLEWHEEGGTNLNPIAEVVGILFCAAPEQAPISRLAVAARIAPSTPCRPCRALFIVTGRAAAHRISPGSLKTLAAAEDGWPLRSRMQSSLHGFVDALQRSSIPPSMARPNQW